MPDPEPIEARAGHALRGLHTLLQPDRATEHLTRKWLPWALGELFRGCTRHSRVCHHWPTKKLGRGRRRAWHLRRLSGGVR